MRVAVIGCGGSRRSFGPALRDCEGLAVAAYVDPDPVSTRVWCRYLARAPAFCDLAHMLAEVAVDAVLVTSPAAGRWREALEAVEAGKHVLCEPPLGRSLEDYDRLAAAAQRTGVVVMPVLPRRHHRLFRWTREAVEEGRIGTPQQVRCEWRFHSGWTRRRTRLRRWRELFAELATHTLDMATWLLGAPHSVSADLDLQAASTRGRRIGNVIVQHARGASIHHIARTDRLETVEQYQVTGEKGCIEVAYGSGWSYDDMSTYKGRLLRADAQPDAQWETAEAEVPEGPFASPYSEMVREFVDTIRSGSRSRLDLVHARTLEEMLVAAALSSIEGSKVALPVLEGPQVTEALRGAGWLDEDGRVAGPATAAPP